MKKTIICGMASLAMATMPVFGAFAETPTLDGGTGSSQKDVTVGEVDETVYSVDLSWSDMVFDWKYNQYTNEYALLNRPSCVMVEHITPLSEEDQADYLSSLMLDGNLYSDFTCTTPATEVDIHTPNFMKAHGAESIFLTDNSTNGQVKASASFTPSENYSWVNGVFSKANLPTLYNEKINNFSYELAENGAFTPMVGDNYHTTTWECSFHLEVNKAIERTNTVSKDDKIGTITINIEPDLN